MATAEEHSNITGVINEISASEKEYVKGFENIVNEKEAQVIEVFEKMLQFCKPEEVMMAFNGGKDCTVVLHILDKFYKQLPLCSNPLTVLYIQNPKNFQEVDDFVEDCQKRYNINLIREKSESIKEALEKVCSKMNHIKTVVLGTRRTDPYSADATQFQKTDPGWPSLMRVNPILDWSCADVWKYIFLNEVPYCGLYRRGFTSLGSRENTVPNPFLKVVHEGYVTYKPAYTLQDDNLERAGRL